MTTIRKTAAWITICAACVAAFEGLRTTPYFDVGGVPTVCYGETAGVRMTDRYTAAQCEEMLSTRIQRDFGPAVDRCLQREVPATRKAAYTSFAYNLGQGTFCRSLIVKYEQASDPVNACAEIIRYNQAKIDGVMQPVRGLTRRRHAEYGLCMQGVTWSSES